MTRYSYDRQVVEAYTSCDVYWLSSRLGGGSGRTSGWLETRGQNDVIHCTWNKDTESPAGVFQLILKSQNDYLEILAPGDLLFLYMGSSHEEKRANLVTVGLIDRIAEARQVQDGATTTSLHVSGRDLGKAFKMTSVVADQAFAELDNAYVNLTFFNTYGNRVIASPSETILRVLNLFYNQRGDNGTVAKQQYSFPTSLDIGIDVRDDVPLIQLLDLSSFVQVPMYGYSWPQSIFAGGSDIWTLCESYANRPFNELFIDVRPDTPEEKAIIVHSQAQAVRALDPRSAASQIAARDELLKAMNYRGLAGLLKGRRTAAGDAASPNVDGFTVGLIHRQTPYDLDAFDKLPTHDIYEAEIRDSSLAVAEHEVFNFFRVRSPDLGPEVLELFGDVLINLSSMRRFGVRRLEAESRYMFSSKQEASDAGAGRAPDPDFRSTYTYYSVLLAVWHGQNDRLLGGTVTVGLRPDIRVGNRVRLLRRDPGGVEEMHFYVQALTHTFQEAQGSSNTVLQLVRGIRRRGSLAQLVSLADLQWDPSKSGEVLDRFVHFSAAQVKTGAKAFVNENVGPAQRR